MNPAANLKAYHERRRSEVRRLHAEGASNTVIAATLGISNQRVSQLLNPEKTIEVKRASRRLCLKPKAEPKAAPAPVTVVEQYSALEMKRRGLPLQYIAAKTRMKYREIEALK
jgi:hypothetical protein